jgi:hypothetical protein
MAQAVAPPHLSLAPNATLEEFLEVGCEGGAEGYRQAVAHLIIAALALVEGGSHAKAFSTICG